MAKEQTNEQKLEIEGVEFLVDMGTGLVFSRIEINVLKEQDKNARIQPNEMMNQLTENIKNRGQLESIPFCAYSQGKVQIISGHHRVRAAKAAGLKKIYVLIDINELTQSNVAAKQIAHNAINGFDDNDVLREIAKLITDVNDKIESYGSKDLFEEPKLTIEKLLDPKTDFDWQQIEFLFLPHQVKDMDALVKKATGKDYIGVAYIDQYEKLLKTLEKYKEFQNVKNVGQAIYMMIHEAEKNMEESGFDPTQEYVPLTRVFGVGAIPVQDAIFLKDAIDKMEKKGIIDHNKKWEGAKIAMKAYVENKSL